MNMENTDESSQEFLEIDENLELLELEEDFDDGPSEIFLLIRIAETLYAIQSSFIKEILHKPNFDILPFAPSYISGILNRHGEPIALLDPNVLLDHEKQNKNIAIIIDSKEKYGFIVSEVKAFVRMKLSEISYDTMFASQFFLFSFLHEDKKISVINPQAFLDYLQKDLQNF